MEASQEATPEIEEDNTALYGDVNEFKKSVKAVVYEKAMERVMPDESVVDDVKKAGINFAMRDFRPEKGTTIVRTKAQAMKALEVLKKYPDRIHAWDTETIGVEVKTESVVGKGTILCA